MTWSISFSVVYLLRLNLTDPCIAVNGTAIALSPVLLYNVRALRGGEQPTSMAEATDEDQPVNRDLGPRVLADNLAGLEGLTVGIVGLGGLGRDFGSGRIDNDRCTSITKQGSDALIAWVDVLGIRVRGEYQNPTRRPGGDQPFCERKTVNEARAPLIDVNGPGVRTQPQSAVDYASGGR